MTRIKHLIVIAGPSCSGKSTLIDKIKDDVCDDFCEKCEITNVSSTLFCNSPKHLTVAGQSDVDKLVLHYDMRFQYSQNYGFNHMKNLINNSKKITVVTLCVSPKTLIKRNKSRALNVFKQYFYRLKGFRRLKGIWERHKDYLAGDSLFLYNEWFNFLKKHTEITHWMVDANLSVINKACPFEIEKARIN